MNRRVTQGYMQLNAVPRERGDEPVRTGYREIQGGRSPRARG